MPLNDLTCAQVVVDLYKKPDSLDSVVEKAGVCIGIRNFSDATVICFRGSTTPQDWWRDFEAQMVDDGQLGGVESGFIEGMRLAVAEIDVRDPIKPLWIVGHSLGAARALICAGLLAVEDFLLPEDQVVTFGSPRPGSHKLKEILANVPIRSYKNRHDPVCGVPVSIPLIDEYLHPRELIPVDVAPPDIDMWGVFADHHSELYLKAMQDAFLVDASAI